MHSHWSHHGSYHYYPASQVSKPRGPRSRPLASFRWAVITSRPLPLSITAGSNPPGQRLATRIAQHEPPRWATQTLPPRTHQRASLCLQEWSSGQMESLVRSARLSGTGNHQAHPKPRRLSLSGPLPPRQSQLQLRPMLDLRIVLRTWKTSVALHGPSSTPQPLTIRRSQRRRNELPC